MDDKEVGRLKRQELRRAPVADRYVFQNGALFDSWMFRKRPPGHYRRGQVPRPDYCVRVVGECLRLWNLGPETREKYRLSSLVE